MTCARCHSKLVRFTIVSGDRPPARELGVCLCCPRGSRYHEVVPDRQRAS